MSRCDADVLIAGGGPVGMALAIELGQRGISVLVVERYEQQQPIPKGQNLTQRTMEHFRVWGAEAELRAARTIPPEYGIGGLTAYRTLLGDYRYDWLPREQVRPYYFTDNERLPQYATEAVLRARAAQLDTVQTLYGWSFEGLTQTGEGVSATATRRDGSDSRTFRARYLVGCDGSRSRVREQAGIVETRNEHDQLMVLLVFRSAELDRLLQRFPGKSFYNVLDPALDGYWKFFGRVDLAGSFFFHAPVPRSAADGGFDFAAYLHQAVGAEFDTAFDHIGFWDLRIASADDYRAGNVFVAGDAAHSHPPYGGYGINTGFEDARNLGWKLAAAIEGWGGTELLDSYDAERRPVFRSTATDFIEKSIAEDGAFLRAFDPARDRAAFEQAWAGRAAGARAEVGSFAPHYRGSPIVSGPAGAPCSAVGRHSFAAEAGTQLAPATLSGGQAVHLRLGDGFTLLAFAGADTAGFASAAERLGIPLTIVADAGTAETARYGAPLILVRPDGFVAWSGGDGAAEEILRRAAGQRARAAQLTDANEAIPYLD